MTHAQQTLKTVLSIQSHVAYGHAGNSAAVFSLQRLGFEVLPVHTVQFSNHTGHGSVRGQIFTPEHLQDVITGIRERGIFNQIDAVLSGYMGDATSGNVILDTVAAIREQNPNALYLCDPVMGDVGRGIFVKEGIPDFIRDNIISQASIITPNQFEFELITQSTLTSVQHAITIAREMIEKTRLQTVLMTSVATPDIPQGQLGTLAVTAQQAWLVTTPLIEISPLPSGMGDTFSSIFLGRILQNLPLEEALALTTATLYELVYHTVKGTRDLPLITHQEQIVSPEHIFAAHAV